MQTRFLKNVLSQPSAPYREHAVSRALKEELIRGKVPHFEDPIGNVVVGAKDRTEYLAKLRTQSRAPLRFFIAHMDHPGFHGVKWLTRRRLKVDWHGGSPNRLLQGASVWLADKKGWLEPGKLTNVKLTPSGRAIQSAVVQFPDSRIAEHSPRARNLFGGFRC